MSSLPRRLQRKRARTAGTYENAPEIYIYGSDGGYSVCHRTKGWRRYSAKRVLAGNRHAATMSLGQLGD